MGGDINVSAAPNGAHLRTMGGDIRVNNARGHVIARTMGGNIRVRDLEGSLLASTMGGNVLVDVTSVAAEKSIELQSMGGSVELVLPASFSGTFEVELEHSDDRDDRRYRIVSDFPLQITESKKERWFRDDVTVLNGVGRTGNGGAHVRIKTVGSDIVIRKK